MDVVGRWWNGLWGRMARRDIWLCRQTSWRVVARQGDSDSGRVQHWEFSDEQQARTMVQRLIAAPGPGDWREHDTGTAPPHVAGARPRET